MKKLIKEILKIVRPPVSVTNKNAVPEFKGKTKDLWLRRNK